MNLVSYVARQDWANTSRCTDLIFVRPTNECFGTRQDLPIDPSARRNDFARYLIGLPRMSYDYPWIDGEWSSWIDVYVDSAWGVDEKERRSTFVGVVFRDGQILSFRSSTQATPSISSGEAEFQAITKSFVDVLYLHNLFAWLGDGVMIGIHSDSIAALGTCKLLGCGKRAEYIEIPYFGLGGGGYVCMCVCMYVCMVLYGMA